MLPWWNACCRAPLRELWTVTRRRRVGLGAISLDPLVQENRGECAKIEMLGRGARLHGSARPSRSTQGAGHDNPFRRKRERAHVRNVYRAEYRAQFHQTGEKGAMLLRKMTAHGTARSQDLDFCAQAPVGPSAMPGACPLRRKAGHFRLPCAPSRTGSFRRRRVASGIVRRLRDGRPRLAVMACHLQQWARETGGRAAGRRAAMQRAARKR